MAIEDDVRAVLAKLDGEQDANAQDNTASTNPDAAASQEEGKRVIHVDKYALPDGSALFRLPTGDAVLVPPGTTDTPNPLDANAIESVAPASNPKTETPTVPLTDTGQEQEEHAPAGKRQRVKPSYVLVALLLLFLLVAGLASYLYLLPMTASATVTITPRTRSLHKDITLTIAANPRKGMVAGRNLAAISLTESATVPATGHGHDDALAATGY